MGMSLNTLIENLKSVKKTGVIKIVQKEIKDIFYIVLYEIAEKTIVDTGQSRSAVIDEFASKNGYSVEKLFTEFYAHWEKNGFPQNEGRRRNNANVNYSQVENKKEIAIGIKINEKGLYAQENANAQGEFKGHQYPSKSHSAETGRDNSSYVPHHITRVFDSWVNNDDISVLINKICLKIENKLFK